VKLSRFSLTPLSYYRPPLGAIAPHSLFLYLDTSLPCPTSFQLVQTSFEVNLYLNKYPSNLVAVILLVHMTYEDGTDRVFQNIGT